MANLASINIKFLADLAQFSSQMQNAERTMKSVGKEFTKTGKSLSIGLTAPLVALGTISAATFITLEQSLAQVRAVSGATVTQFKLLSDNAMELGRTTKFTASEVAGLQLAFSKLGFKPEEIVDATAATLDLAIATGEDLAASATIAAGTIRGFGLDVKDAGRVTDVMALSFSSSALDLDKFSTAMAAVAPVAKNAGVSLEETTAMLSVLVDANIDASTAGTALRNIFLETAKQGITLKGALDLIKNSADKNVTALNLFGTRGATVAAVLADNQEKANALTISYDAAAGSAKRMADIMSNTTAGSLDRLKSALEGAAIEIGKLLAPAINKLANFVGMLAGKFSELSTVTKKIIVVIAGLAAVLGPLLITVGFMATNVIPGLMTAFTALSTNVIPKIITAFATLKGAFIAFSATIAANPIGALVVALGALVAIIVALNIDWSKLTNALGNGFTIILNGVKTIYNSMKQLALSFDLTPLKNFFSFFGGGLSSLNGLLIEWQLNIAKGTSYIVGLSAAVKQVSQSFNTLLSNLFSIKDIDFTKPGEAFKKLAAIGKQSFEVIKEPLTAYREEQSKFLKEQVNLIANSFIQSKQNIETGESFITLANNIENASEKMMALGEDGKKTDKKLKNITGLQTVFAKIAAPLAATALSATQSASMITDSMYDMIETTVLFNEALGPIMEQAAESFLIGFGALIGNAAAGGNFLKGFAQLFLGTLADLAINVGTMAIKIGVAVKGIRVALESLNPAVAIAAGIALVALGTFAKSAMGNIAGGGATPFAKGGIVYGPTNALVGEYAGARTNPEVIAPLNKLKKLIEPASGGYTNVTVGGEFILRGDTLVQVIQRTESRNNRTR
jgi:hypothetical protein